MMGEAEELLTNNRQWAEEIENKRPGFFSLLLRQQAPQYLWIGCADSRVPANELVGLEPGELFVHRNIANVVAHSDLNCLSVIQYAVDQLNVKHIMVVGHSGCGGVRAALEGLRIGVADNWVRHVGDVIDRHRRLLRQIPSGQRIDAACELNVLEQAVNVCRTTVVQDAWQRGQKLVVHGWVYGLHNGILENLGLTLQSTKEIEPTYAKAFKALKQRYIHRPDAHSLNLLCSDHPRLESKSSTLV